jgi:hypothetical protein
MRPLEIIGEFRNGIIHGEAKIVLENEVIIG